MRLATWINFRFGRSARDTGGRASPVKAAAGGVSFETLFDPEFLARLDPFVLRIARAQKGGRLADQRTSARGQGSEFADFKPYAAGDDLRAIDWNIYRRLGRVFVRVFEERQDLPVQILLDMSDSMFAETTPRYRTGARVALAIAAVALDQNDAVGLHGFGDDLTTRIRPTSGRRQIPRLAQNLAEAQPMGRSAMAKAIRRLATQRSRRGLVVVVSDFFSDEGLPVLLSALEDLPHRLLLVQLTRAHDADPSLHPEFRGEVAVIDGEGGAPMVLSVSDAVVARCRRAHEAFATGLTEFALRHGAGLVRIDTDEDLLEQLERLFGAGSVLR